MPTGILGQAAPAALTDTIVYTVPTLKVATFTVSIVNRGILASSVRVAIANTSTPTNAEWIEYGTVIPPSGILERTGLVAQAGKNIVVYTSTADFSISIYGYEE